MATKIFFPADNIIILLKYAHCSWKVQNSKQDMAVDNLTLVYKSVTILHLCNRCMGLFFSADYFHFIDFDIPEFLELKKIPWITTKASLKAGLRSAINKGRKIRICWKYE